DYVQLSQVLTNLVDNAIRHGDPGSPVVVTVADAHIAVQNRGRQLSEEERDHIFDRFYRGSGQVSGTGLGLAIAKGIVEAHGGSIHAENIPGGVIFHVWLTEPAHIQAAGPDVRPVQRRESLAQERDTVV
ncbi:MAG: sensor histidine kinase, partial [Chloroflexota bacterium]|nr:sensor histidine kinase [Chloroflexota bacterium]